MMGLYDYLGVFVETGTTLSLIFLFYVGRKLRKIDLKNSLFCKEFFVLYCIMITINGSMVAGAIVFAILYGVVWYYFVIAFIPIYLISPLITEHLVLSLLFGNLFSQIQKPKMIKLNYMYSIPDVQFLSSKDDIDTSMYKLWVRLRFYTNIVMFLFFYMGIASLFAYLIK